MDWPHAGLLLITAGGTPPIGFHGSSLLKEADIENFFTKSRNKLWGFFSGVGLVSSGVIGVIMIKKMIIWIVDSFLNGALLYKAYGFSWAIVGSRSGNVLGP